jgi:hypothetical protein
MPVTGQLEGQMRQPTRPGEHDPQPTQGEHDPQPTQGEHDPQPAKPATDHESLAAPDPLSRLDARLASLPPLTELRTHLEQMSAELDAKVGGLRSRRSRQSLDLRSKLDGLDPDDPRRLGFGLELRWGKPKPGDPRR